MPLNDSQLVGLLHLFLLQQKDILEMKAQITSLRRALIGVCGDAIVEPMKQEYEDFLHSSSLDGSQKAIEAIESVIAQLLPTTGSKN